jgi:HTH-type transcriptional regulator/antitoxin HigA
MKNYTPAEVYPPGEFLKEELEARGWSQADLADILGRPPRLVSEIIGGKRAISPETAQGLGEAKRAKLFEKAPIKELIRRHWIKACEDANELEAQLLAFFGITSLEAELSIFPHAARKSSPYESVTPAQWAWLSRARRLATLIDAARYDAARFEELLERLRPLLSEPEEARHVPKILAEYGIRLVIVEPLADTKLDGACMWLDATSPVIVLSIRFDRIDWFWFTLLHELGHVKAQDGLRNNAIPIDTDLVGQGAKKSEEKPESEQAADRFAMENIVSRPKLQSFIARTRPLYYKEKIRGFAAVNGIHPGIVVGQLQHRGEISYAHNREMLAKVRDIVTRASLTDGWGSTPIV